MIAALSLSNIQVEEFEFGAIAVHRNSRPRLTTLTPMQQHEGSRLSRAPLESHAFPARMNPNSQSNLHEIDAATPPSIGPQNTLSQMTLHSTEPGTPEGIHI